MVIEDNASTINSKTKKDQELNPKVKVTKSLFSKIKKNRVFSLFESIMVRIAEVDKES